MIAKCKFRDSLSKIFVEVGSEKSVLLITDTTPAELRKYISGPCDELMRALDGHNENVQPLKVSDTLPGLIIDVQNSDPGERGSEGEP
jgi:hypothetical protein